MQTSTAPGFFYDQFLKMDIYKLKDLSEQDRQTVFLGEADGAEEQVYLKPLTPEELAITREEHSNASILLDELIEKFSDVKARHKEEIKPINSKRKAALKAIRQKAIEITGKVWRLPDYENSMMHFITNEGQVLSSRPMLPQERQFKIQQLNKAI